MSRAAYMTLITLLLAACGGGGVSPANFLQPQVSLHQVKLRTAGITGGTLDAQLAIANPNHIELKGAKLTAGLDLSGQHFGDLVTDQDFILTKDDTTLITLPLTFKWSDMASAAKNILGYGEVDYHMAGTMSVTNPLTVDVPFTKDGTVSVVK
jgi:late embryogenesis abundant protein